MSKYRDIFSGVLVLCFTLLLYVLTLDINEVSFAGVGADFMPRILVVTLGILGCALTVTSVLEYKRIQCGAKAKPAPDKEPAPNGYLLVSANILLFVLYIYFLDSIGFIITTTIFIFLQILILTERKKNRYGLFAIIALTTSVCSFYVFIFAFQVLLPAGILG